ncbi:MATE family efflux transporter [Piscinibacter sp.]|uniref:MATE family efflux transporter n=1 Tax=Piscinibacter sp. TaxID=1903157 RepID=UPI003559C405
MPASPRPRLNAVAVPIVGEFLLGMSVAMAGLWLASHTSDAAAGTFGLSIQVLETLFVLFRVLAIGVGVVTTQALGGQQPEVAHRTALVGLGASTWAGLLAAACVVFGNELTLDLLNAPDEILPLAAPYLQLLAPALLLEAYNLTMASILRAHLHARQSLQIMLAMHGTHLLLAVPLMLGVGEWDGLGLYGYALALTASRGLGLLLHLWMWRRMMALAPRARDWWSVSPGFIAPVLRIGLPGAALEMVYRLAFMVSLATAAKLGVGALATHSYVLQTLKYVLVVSMSIGWACEIMVGRLVGSGDLRTAHQLVNKGLRNGFLASGGLAVAAALAAPWLMRAFTKDPAIIHAAQVLLFIAIALETGRAFNLIVIGALRAAGDAIYPVAASVASLIVVLGVGSYFMGRAFGLPGIFIAYAADEWIRGLLMQARWVWHGWVPHARETQRRVRWRR